MEFTNAHWSRNSANDRSSLAEESFDPAAPDRFPVKFANDDEFPKIFIWDSVAFRTAATNALVALMAAALQGEQAEPKKFRWSVGWQLPKVSLSHPMGQFAEVWPGRDSQSLKAESISSRMVGQYVRPMV